MEPLIQQYSKIILAIKKLKEKNEDVFQKLEILEIQLKFLKDELSKEVVESKLDQENAFYKVSYVERWKKWYSCEVLSKIELKMLEEQGCLIKQIDKKLLEQAIKENRIPRSIKQKAFQEELQTKMALIKKK